MAATAPAKGVSPVLPQATDDWGLEDLPQPVAVVYSSLFTNPEDLCRSREKITEKVTQVGRFIVADYVVCPWTGARLPVIAEADEETE